VKDLRKNVYEFTDFLVNVLKVEDLGARFEGKAAYHDSCASLREYAVGDAPRKLLANVRGLQLSELKDNTTCCGFGGTFAVKFDTISYAMGEQKVNNASDTGAEYLISTDMSCLMHLDGVMKKKEMGMKVLHIADVLASGY
jgi:L-lactate dehydrogenase complex protein LldE